MITAHSGLLREICEIVDGLITGECVTFDWYMLRDIATYSHNNTVFTAPDRILGNIVGSAYTHSYTQNRMDGTVTFHRHKEDGTVYHRDPDRR